MAEFSQGEGSRGLTAACHLEIMFTQVRAGESYKLR